MCKDADLSFTCEYILTDIFICKNNLSVMSFLEYSCFFFFHMWICIEFLYLRWRQLCLENGTDILVSKKIWSLADVNICSFSVFDTDSDHMGADWAMTQALSVVWGLYSVTVKNVICHMAESIILRTQKKKKKLNCLSLNCFNTICIQKHSYLMYQKDLPQNYLKLANSAKCKKSKSSNFKYEIIFFRKQVVYVLLFKRERNI